MTAPLAQEPVRREEVVETPDAATVATSARPTEAPSPPPKAPVDRWTRAANIATALGLLTTGASACWALFNYQSELETKRAEKTIEYISLWENEGPQQSYRYLEKIWAEFLTEVPNDQRAVADTDANAKATLINRFYAASLQDEQWQAAVSKTSYFFNRLGLCVEANLCSEAVTRVFFGDIIKSYVVVFGPYIQKNQSSTSGSLDVIRRPLE